MDFGEDWWNIETESEKFKQAFLDQLYKELPKGHLLDGISLIVLAKSEINDDILVKILDNSEKVAQVHLTWRNDNHQNDLTYPKTQVFDNIEQWKNTVQS